MFCILLLSLAVIIVQALHAICLSPLALIFNMYGTGQTHTAMLFGWLFVRDPGLDPVQQLLFFCCFPQPHGANLSCFPVLALLLYKLQQKQLVCWSPIITLLQRWEAIMLFVVAYVSKGIPGTTTG